MYGHVFMELFHILENALTSRKNTTAVSAHTECGTHLPTTVCGTKFHLDSACLSCYFLLTFQVSVKICDVCVICTVFPGLL